VYSDDLAMQLVQNAGRRHLMMADTDEAVWSDSLMPLELLMQSEDRLYMAVIDRNDMSIAECMGSGQISTSFGGVTLEEDTGIAVVNGPFGSIQLSVQPDVDVQAVVLDKQSGEVLYQRAVRL
jgi:hypothetical protein